MFNGRTTNTKLNHRTFEKALQLACKGSESKLEKLKGKYDHLSVQSAIASATGPTCAYRLSKAFINVYSIIFSLMALIILLAIFFFVCQHKKTCK